MLYHTVSISSDHDAVVWAGDVFHHKSPSRNSHRLVQRAIGVVKAYGPPLFIVPGNHDLSSDRLESLPSQPLGTLFHAGAHYLDGWAPPRFSLPLFGIPWQQRWLAPNSVEDAFTRYGWDPDRFPHPLVVTHAPLFPPGHEFSLEFVPTDGRFPERGKGWSEVQRSGSCYYGHIHEAHGVYAVPNSVSSVSFANHGALSRGSLAEADVTREISVTAWSPSSGFSRVPVPHKPASEVLRVEESVVLKAARADLGEFLAGVGETRLEVASIESVVSALSGSEVDPAVRDRAVALLRGVL